MTSQLQISTARSIATLLQSVIPQADVRVDDWSDYASFRIFIKFTRYCDASGIYTLTSQPNLKAIGWSIKRVFKKVRAEIETVCMPERIYEVSGRERYFRGYNYPYITVDFKVWDDPVIEPEKPREVQLML